MKILIGVKGTERDAYFHQVAALIPWADAAEIILVHAIDATAHAGIDRGRERYFGRRPLSEGRAREIAAVEEARARAILQFGCTALAAAGLPADRVREITLRGRPRESLRDLAERERIDLIVVAAREGPPGPHSLGKTARFLVDHAPRAALLVRSLMSSQIPRR